MTLIEFKNTEFKIGTLRLEGVIWFLSKDVCDALAVRNHRAAVNRLDEDERTMAAVDDTAPVCLISESGLYSLIARNRSPQAKAFRRWMTGDVLPALRMQGSYQMTQLDEQRISEIRAEVEGVKKKLARNLARLWKVQEVDGNVSLKAYLGAAGLSLTAKECMRLGARCNFRCRVHGSPVGRLQQRRGRTQKLSAGHQRHGWHLVSTFPPQHIAVEARALGYEHKTPSMERLAEVMKSLVPVGHRLNPPTPEASLYR